MYRRSVNKISSYILDCHYLEAEISLDELGCDLNINRPHELTLQEEEWEDLSDKNSDAMYQIGEQLRLNNSGRLNKASGPLADLLITPSEHSKLLATGKLKSLIRELFDKVEEYGELEKGYAFERLCESALKSIWDYCERVGKTGDGGIDIICKNSIELQGSVEVTQIVQCKYYGKPLDAPYVRKLLGDVIVHIFEESNICLPIIPVLLTNKGFTKNAISAAKKYGVRTMTFSQLLEELLEKGQIDHTRLIRDI